MLESFETFIERANAARTPDELVAEFLRATKRHGLDRMIFCLQTPHPQLGLKPGVGVIQNYPEDWMNYYFEKGYDRIDPVITYCQNKLDTFTWAEIPERFQMTRAQFQCLNLGIEAGLYNGVCTPLWGPNQFAGVGLASAERLDSFDGNLDLITAYCNHFYLAFQRLHRQTNRPDHNIYLTPREEEVLTWAAAGKTDYEIGFILNLSEDTVDSYFRQIFKKFDAHSRIVAVAKAISYGLIKP